MIKINLDKQMFCDNPIRFDKLCNTKYLIDSPAEVIEVENGIVLPLKSKFNGWSCDAEGGICDSNGVFVEGHLIFFENNNSTQWRKCTKAYKFDEQIKKRNETVIYGGVLIENFGHFITECFSRLWYIVQNPNVKFKIIFLNFEKKDKVYNEHILTSIGLNKEQYEVITTPTQFDKIIVPYQSIYIGDAYRKECKLVYDHIISKVKPASFKKIYLSKSKYHANKSDLEVYFDNFYRKRGFEIIYPETLSFMEQVAILNGADEVACSMGTIQHLTFFCRDNVKLTVFAREYNAGPINRLGMFSIQLRNLETYFVDITYNFLPVAHVDSIFFIGPTKQWINYLNSQNISYEQDEVSFDIHVKPYVYDYLVQWAKHYDRKLNAYNRVKNQTLPDVINLIHRTFLDKTIDTKKFPESDYVLKLKGEVDSLKKNEISINDEIEKINSKYNPQFDNKTMFERLDKHTSLYDKKLDSVLHSKDNEITQLREQLHSAKLEIVRHKEQAIYSQKQVSQHKGEVAFYKKEVNKYKGQVRYHKRGKEDIIHSLSYKLGRAITWLPRKVIGIFIK